jgi:hypothetical protein
MYRTVSQETCIGCPNAWIIAHSLSRAKLADFICHATFRACINLMLMRSPTLFNAGTPTPQMSSCFLVHTKEDSIEGHPIHALLFSRAGMDSRFEQVFDSWSVMMQESSTRSKLAHSSPSRRAASVISHSSLVFCLLSFFGAHAGLPITAHAFNSHTYV